MSDDAFKSADSTHTVFEQSLINQPPSDSLLTANKPTQSGLPGLPGKKFVFKYRQLNQQALEIIRIRQLHFANPASLNDPFDCDLESIVEGTVEQLENLWEDCLNQVIRVRQAQQLMYTRYRDEWSDPREERNDHNFWRSRLDDHYGRDALLQFIEEYDSLLNGESAGNDPHYRRLLQDFYASLIRLGKEKFGICSMGGDPTSILMWSHYAANHTGFGIAAHHHAPAIQKFTEKIQETGILEKKARIISQGMRQIRGQGQNILRFLSSHHHWCSNKAKTETMPVHRKTTP